MSLLSFTFFIKMKVVIKYTVVVYKLCVKIPFSLLKLLRFFTVLIFPWFWIYISALRRYNALWGKRYKSPLSPFIFFAALFYVEGVYFLLKCSKYHKCNSLSNSSLLSHNFYRSDIWVLFVTKLSVQHFSRLKSRCQLWLQFSPEA